LRLPLRVDVCFYGTPTS